MPDAVLRPQQEIRGRFKPGQSGNPGGRRPGGYKYLVEKLKTLEDDAFETLKSAIKQRPVGPVGVAACVVVFDRTMGKPKQVVTVEGDIEIRVSDDLRKARQRMQQLGREIIEGVAEAVVAAEES